MNDPITGLILGGGAVALFVVAFALVRKFLYICRPNEILVFSGRSRRLADGSSVGYEVMQHGRRLRIPVLETAEKMDMTTMTVDITVRNAYSRGNIPLNVHAIANVKIASEPGIVERAVERFLGRNRSEISRVAKETIEGSLRGILARLTPEQVNEDRLSFAEELTDECDEDLEKIGLILDTLKIQSVTDDVNYLDSIGRERIAEVIRDAEVAESDNEREADEAVADAKGRSEVAEQQVEARIQEAQNALRQLVAELDARARSEEETTEAAWKEARARAEAKLQEIRTELEQLRLQAEEVLPAGASQRAKELAAQGEKAIIAEEGRANAEALRLISEAWADAGPHAEEIFIIQQLESLLERIAQSVRQIRISKVRLIDGGDGDTLGRLVGAYPSMIFSVLDSLSDSMGVDVLDVLRQDGGGQSEGRGPDGGGGGSGREKAARRSPARSAERVGRTATTAARTKAAATTERASHESPGASSAPPVPPTPSFDTSRAAGSDTGRSTGSSKESRSVPSKGPTQELPGVSGSSPRMTRDEPPPTPAPSRPSSSQRPSEQATEAEEAEATPDSSTDRSGH